MAFFTIQRNGFTKVSDMMSQIIIDMADHGFDVIYPENFNPASALTSPFKVVLQATTDVDPLAQTQPWRVCFDVTSEQACAAYAATPLQISNTGSVSALTDATGAIKSLAGAVGSIVPAMISTDPGSGLFNRTRRVASANSGTFPLNYRLTITDHGFFIGAFEGNWSSVIFETGIDAYLNWMLVQRPVNKQTGAPLITGKCPVFCVNKVNDRYWKFIVRESDIPHPTQQVPANAHTEDNFRIINTKNQVSVTEDKSYLVSFMNNLNTPRFRYTEELDVIGIVSADVVMESIPLSLTAYGQSRQYTALPGSDDFNTGVRVLVMTSTA